MLFRIRPDRLCLPPLLPAFTRGVGCCDTGRGTLVVYLLPALQPLATRLYQAQLAGSVRTGAAGPSASWPKLQA